MAYIVEADRMCEVRVGGECHIAVIALACCCQLGVVVERHLKKLFSSGCGLLLVVVAQQDIIWATFVRAWV